MVHKLIVDNTPASDLRYVVEEQNGKSNKRLYIEGPYMLAGAVNRNKREYDPEEMFEEITRYTTEVVKENRAYGELNHPTSAEVDLERACHMVTELRMDDNVVYGKSRVLTSTPTGKIVEGIINDGGRVGVSSRCLGQLTPMEGQDEVNSVSNMRLIAIDCVADPSFPKAFVNGILESREFVLQHDGSFEELYDQFNNDIKQLPKKQINEYLTEKIVSFIKGLKSHE